MGRPPGEARKLSGRFFYAGTGAFLAVPRLI